MNYEKRIWLITGGTGSLGRHLVKRILKDYDPKEVRIFSRTEGKQVEFKREINDVRVKFIIGDVRSKASIKKAVYGSNIIIHTAAMKHVPICEEFPYECVWTNIIGTENLIECSLSEKVEKFISISTDKASKPGNAYGYSKALMESLVISSNKNKGNRQTVFSCVRFGNLAGSAGSVIELFRRQIKEGKNISLTDPNMTRFFLTMEKAVDCILYAVEKSSQGEVFIPKMSALKMNNLASAIISESGDKKIEIKVVGPRPGEKTHESIISEDESLRTLSFDSYYIIFPTEQRFHIPKKEVNSISVKEMSLEVIKELLGTCK